MPSQARARFDKNADDVARLLEIHADLGGDNVGRRVRLEVLNKSAIVLVTAFWEAYCEDLAAEALESIVTHASAATSLPKDLKQQIATELKAATNALAVWDLADQAWRALLKKRLADLTAVRNRKLNTPKSENIDDLFHSAVGLKAVSGSWRWRRTTVASARTKLDRFVTLRGEVAHRGNAASACRKVHVESFFTHVKHLVEKTDAALDAHVRSVTGKGLWEGEAA
jgi:hypothetical protein